MVYVWRRSDGAELFKTLKGYEPATAFGMCPYNKHPLALHRKDEFNTFLTDVSNLPQGTGTPDYYPLKNTGL